MSSANVKVEHALACETGRSQKLAVMEECGIHITRNPAEIGELARAVLK
ncbi:MAG TPA: hypothetical protein VIA64_03335 [Burkholderiales bacterium]|jgi:succinyl-CoA synthetase alpha subunit